MAKQRRRTGKPRRRTGKARHKRPMVETCSRCSQKKPVEWWIPTEPWEESPRPIVEEKMDAVCRDCVKVYWEETIPILREGALVTRVLMVRRAILTRFASRPDKARKLALLVAGKIGAGDDLDHVELERWEAKVGVE